MASLDGSETLPRPAQLSVRRSKRVHITWSRSTGKQPVETGSMGYPPHGHNGLLELWSHPRTGAPGKGTRKQLVVLQSIHQLLACPLPRGTRPRVTPQFKQTVVTVWRIPHGA